MWMSWCAVMTRRFGRRSRSATTSATVAENICGICETCVPYAKKMSETILCIYLFVQKK